MTDDENRHARQRAGLWQARTVARLITKRGGPACEIVVIRTSGDESAGPPDRRIRTAARPDTGSEVKRCS